MKIDPNSNAYPTPIASDCSGAVAYSEESGMTIRAVLAKDCLIQIMAKPTYYPDMDGCRDTVSRLAVKQADALIAALNKGQ